ncbi:hypothetical protein CRG98_029916 [Punica granatum]|uniref:Reverse transcriptase Ty1/copia-type domain-containing protein n=1 Tax=Punica granatum TaxID=22663 RepID=A0A2I0J096_PUNGR|nr:hypothetical protein CRG98_029916 [Punica granatum]
MAEESNALIQNGTWSLAPLPPRANVVGITWKFRIKYRAAKRIMRYLRGTISHGLTLRKSSDVQITAYTDADWASCPDTRRSTTSYAVFVGPNLVSWRSKKQPTVSKSSTENEYRALTYAEAGTLWLRQLIRDIGRHSPSPIITCCDNISATYLAANPFQHQRSKHIAVDYHFVLEWLQRGDLLINAIVFASCVIMSVVGLLSGAQSTKKRKTMRFAKRILLRIELAFFKAF